jgi:class 3 adenylate cyclase
MADAVVTGRLQLKQAASVGNSWFTYLAEYDATTKTLACKSEDGKLLYASLVIEGAWALEPKAGRREGRFDVLTGDGATAAFAAASNADAKHWVEVSRRGASLEKTERGCAARRWHLHLRCGRTT